MWGYRRGIEGIQGIGMHQFHEPDHGSIFYAWIFILTAGITFVIAFISISFMAFKAAAANPVDSLHYE